MSTLEILPQLTQDLRTLIQSSRTQALVQVNREMVALYWHMGKRIRGELHQHARGEYGRQVVAALADQLSLEFGTGFSKRNLHNMVRLVEVFPEFEIVQTLSAQLSWSHLVEIIYRRDPLERAFYLRMAALERWSVRTRKERISALLFQRTALVQHSAAALEAELERVSEGNPPSPGLLWRDPYLLDFLELRDSYSERDLEQALLRELERFLLELGSGFAFLERQKRISIGDKDYYLDLLFYHRSLRRLVVIELKLGAFEAAHKGQMELYLRWLDKHERQPHEHSPIGLILCAEKDAEHVELLDLEQSGIHVAEYLTQLPPLDVLERRLQQALVLARERAARRYPPQS